VGLSASNTARVPTRRNAELALLLVAVAVLFVFETTVEIAQADKLTSNGFMLTAVFAVAFGAGHIIVRIFAPYADPVLLPCAGLLTGIGVVFIRRLDMSDSALNDDVLVPLYPTQADRAAMSPFEGSGGGQLIFFLGCMLVLGAALWFIKDHRSLSRYPYIIGLAGLVLAASPAVLGEERFGSKLWIDLGFISVQPSEFAKLLLLLFFAYYLVRKREVLSLASKKILGLPFPRARDLFPVLAVWLVSLLIMIGIRDLGTSLLFFGIFVAMLYVATERVSWIIIGLLLFSGGAVLMFTLFSHLQLRVRIWLDPFADPTGDGFQIVQSLIGLGSGGLFGAGPGAGQPQSVGFAANSDFIIVGLGEELGLFGLSGILMLYMLLMARGMRAGLAVRDSFGKLLAGGLAFGLGFQVFVIVGGVTKLIPLTGQTAPFLSAGGSSLIANWILVAMLIRISDAGRRPQSAPVGPIKIAPPPPPVDNSPTQIVSIPQHHGGHDIDQPEPNEDQTQLTPQQPPPADSPAPNHEVKP
jgi:cell division protein FtsW (lipid II flippase)